MKTDDGLSKKRFYSTRKPDNTVEIHDKDDEDREFIRSEFLNDEAEAMSKTAEMRKREKEIKAKNYSKQENQENLEI